MFIPSWGIVPGRIADSSIMTHQGEYIWLSIDFLPTVDCFDSNKFVRNQWFQYNTNYFIITSGFVQKLLQTAGLKRTWHGVTATGADVAHHGCMKETREPDRHW